MDSGTLYTEIAKVCPVVSTTVGKADDRSTWTFVAEAAATQPEKDAADNVIQTIPIEGLPKLQPADFIARFTDAEYLLLKQKQQADLTASDASSTRIWDIVIGKPTLNMNTSDAQTLKAQLVTDGILTQARADQIFSEAPAKSTKFS